MTTEKKSFSAEIGKVLQLMIHSIYTNKEIFLRELISNASDACDKLRFLSITQPELLNEELAISIEVSEEDKTLTIIDNGIGMNRQELIDNLGTIASSGTKKFLEAMANNNEDYKLIGQFGVGFYSAFMVANKVEVFTRKAGSEESYFWESDGQSGYQMTSLEESVPVGTKVVLYIKPEEDEFLNRYRVEHIIKTYSDLISFPINLKFNDTTERINNTVALWTKQKSEITEEQYNDFYHYISHSPDTSWMRIHYKAEGGAVEYICLLYIPSTKPFDLFNPDRQDRVKLYIKKVLINEGIEGLIPSFLRFLRGVIDSDDLPLNISRQTVQNNSALPKIRKSITNKIINLLKERMEKDCEDYYKFWLNFGEVLKEGLCEPALEEKERILEICCFYSTIDDRYTTLNQYIGRMIEGQNKIFYLNGSNIDLIRSNPQLEGYLKRGIEVLLMTDGVDDFWLHVITQYKNFEFCSITKENINLDDIKKIPNEEENQDQESAEKKIDNVQELLDYIKITLDNKVKDVRVSTKLVDSPACLAITEGGLDIRMEKFLIAQKQKVRNSLKILEINTTHDIIKKIAYNLKNNVNDELNRVLVSIIFDEACIIAGEDMSDQYAFCKNVNNLILRSLT